MSARSGSKTKNLDTPKQERFSRWMESAEVLNEVPFTTQGFRLLIDMRVIVISRCFSPGGFHNSKNHTLAVFQTLGSGVICSQVAVEIETQVDKLTIPGPTHVGEGGGRDNRRRAERPILSM